jgi:spermidine synthase
MPEVNKWYQEVVLPSLVCQVELKRTVFSGRTRYQDVEIVETGPFGLTLALDGKTQSAQADEFIYHEALVHPALTVHPQPRSVLIAGGGEGATLREVLRHDCVERAVMVDLDGELVDICRKELPAWHQGALDNPRAEVIYGDALAYVRDHAERFDVIIVDVNDPTEGGPSYLLYTDSFYRTLRERLGPGGVIVTQAGPASIGTAPVIAAISATVRSAFGHAHPFKANMLSFGCDWGFVMAGLGPLGIEPSEVDRRLAQRGVSGKLRFYDGLAHQGLFGIPLWLRRQIDSEARVITEQDPIFSVF